MESKQKGPCRKRGYTPFSQIISEPQLLLLWVFCSAMSTTKQLLNIIFASSKNNLFPLHCAIAPHGVTLIMKVQPNRSQLAVIFYLGEKKRQTFFSFLLMKLQKCSFQVSYYLLQLQNKAPREILLYVLSIMALALTHLIFQIADLGVACFKNWSRLTKEETTRQKKIKSASQNNAGTLFYMAPEHLRSVNVKPDEKSDIYSFGIVIWAIFANKEPYERKLLAKKKTKKLDHKLKLEMLSV